MSGQVCLRYHLGWCSGVCEQKVPADEYAHAVERAAALLSHPHDDLILEMKGRMWACAERLEFERAQHIRDQIQALESALERQVVERKVGHDQDVIYFGEHKALVTRVRRGVVQGMHLCDLDATDGYDKACADFLLAHYANGSPRELIVNRLSHLQEVERALALANQCPVRITLPQRGAKRELLRLCEQNYDYRVSIQDAGCRVQDAG